MRYYYDFEFIEDGRTIDPISLGMVSEDGREYYAVFEDSHARPGFNVMHLMLPHEWLMKNVFPSLPYKRSGDLITLDVKHKDYKYYKKRSQVKQDLLDFTAGTKPEFWAWYADYDHVALCQLFGRMIDLPDYFPMYTRDIKQVCDEKGNPQLPKQPDGIHNALADAKHNKVRLDFLEGL